MENNVAVKSIWDDNRRQVVMIIYSNYPNNGQNKNGEIDYISSLKDKTQFYHSVYYVKHAETNYNNDPQYQLSINDAKRSFNHFKLLFFNTNKFKNIVFDHVHNDQDGKDYGVLSLPPTEPTKKQYEALDNLLIKLNEIGYEQIFIQGSLSANNQGLLKADISLIIEGKDIPYIPEIIKDKYNKLNKKRGRQLW